MALRLDEFDFVYPLCTLTQDFAARARVMIVSCIEAGTELARAAHLWDSWWDLIMSLHCASCSAMMVD